MNLVNGLYPDFFLMLTVSKWKQERPDYHSILTRRLFVLFKYGVDGVLNGLLACGLKGNDCIYISLLKLVCGICIPAICPRMCLMPLLKLQIRPIQPIDIFSLSELSCYSLNINIIKVYIYIYIYIYTYIYIYKL